MGPGFFRREEKGRPIQTADAWIAASALYYQVPLITNNRADYSAVDGLVVLSA
jgi:predicted nucleic acid-binding protein